MVQSKSATEAPKPQFHQTDGSRLAARTAASFTFVDCAYSVAVKSKGRRGQKVLLQNCAASVAAGQTLAILGPSGAGKTTLLNTLTLTPGGGKPVGRMTLNGQPFTLGVYRRHAASVAQTDLLWTFLTAREHVEYASAFYQSTLTTDERQAFVTDVLMETGLEGCADTRAGNQFFKGLSGGQRRRLSLAVALCKRPNIVFLDEPTSGLDAAAAASIMKFLKVTAERLHLAIVCTVHQPSTSVFGGFDCVGFLTGGKLAYLGKATELVGYLAAIGEPVPEHANPADVMLDLINRDFTDGEQVDHMLAEWEKRQVQIEAPAAGVLEAEGGAPLVSQLR
eukprot:545137-Prymnesium_polylepis.1